MALRVGDSVNAAEVFESALAAPGLGPVERGEAEEGLAQVAYLEHRYEEAVERWRAAYQNYRSNGEGPGAVRVARTLSFMYGAVLGDVVVGKGWQARASTLLADQGPSLESGWVSLCAGLFEPAPDVQERCYRDALRDRSSLR